MVEEWMTKNNANNKKTDFGDQWSAAGNNLLVAPAGSQPGITDARRAVKPAHKRPPTAYPEPVGIPYP
jgi:hypothetical protein